MFVDDKTLKDLEWSTVLKHLARYASSEPGKALCLNLLPANDKEDVEEMLAQTTQAKKLFQQGLTPPMGGIFQIKNFLQKAEIGSSLENKDFIDIGSTLLASKCLKDFMEDKQEHYPAIYELSSLLLDHDRLINEIYRCFDTSGNMQDTASPELKRLRDSMRDQANNLKDKLNALLSSRSIATYLQEPVYTIRNDRYVVPVKAEHKSDVPGIVHDSSASGVTFYIEPRAIVELNNKLKETELKIDHEISRILSELTIHVAQNAERIRATIDLLAQLDLIFAKARYSLFLDAGEPEINTSKMIKLKMVRHPILVTTIKTVVSNTVELGEEYNTMIITGANTGGKTVMLKTIGLCVLMAGAGLHIPAESDSSVYLFSSVFADIGEEQSLEHNLSTFSAKMTNIINIVNKADEESLVLLDELGAGTDPAEGTALAQAIMEELNSNGSNTVVTTHYGGLKTLAFSHKGFCNASVEFDFDTLTPTFRLLMGVPGQSNATTIAKNLGLSSKIVSRAEEIYTSSIDDFSIMLDDLQKVQREITKELDLARSERKEYQELKVQYNELVDKMTSAKKDSLLAFRRNLNSELNKAKSEVIEILHQLKEEKTEKSAKRAHSNLSNLGYTTNKKIDEYKDSFEERKKTTPVDRNKLEIGNKVFIPKLNQEGIILSLPDKNDRVTLQMGLVKSNLNIDELEELECSGKPDFIPKFKSSTNKATTQKKEYPSMKCDLRGKTVDEGLHELEIFLDKAAMSNIPAIYVIHGHGTGVLRKAVRSYLKESPYVQNYRPGEQSEGGDGVSVVELC